MDKYDAWLESPYYDNEVDEDDYQRWQEDMVDHLMSKGQECYPYDLRNWYEACGELGIEESEENNTPSPLSPIAPQIEAYWRDIAIYKVERDYEYDE